MRGYGLLTIAVLAAIFAIAGHSVSTSATQNASQAWQALPHSPIPGLTRKIGLWDKPNQACITKCEAFVDKGCFKTLSEKNPTADPASIQDQCEDKFNICLYDCMCDTCDENQIIIKQP